MADRLNWDDTDCPSYGERTTRLGICRHTIPDVNTDWIPHQLKLLTKRNCDGGDGAEGCPTDSSSTLHRL